MQSKRVDRLEEALGPRALGGDIKAWAAVYGWKQVYEWDRLSSARAYRTLLEFLPGRDMEPVPDPTPEEIRFHEAMNAAITPEEAKGTMNWLYQKLGLSR
jgi:hypothetical protein